MSESWTTFKEMEYVSGIGTSKNESGIMKLSFHTKQELLENYIDAAHKRMDWGNINRYEVIDHALKLLRGLK